MHSRQYPVLLQKHLTSVIYVVRFFLGPYTHPKPTSTFYTFSVFKNKSKYLTLSIRFRPARSVKTNQRQIAILNWQIFGHSSTFPETLSHIEYNNSWIKFHCQRLWRKPVIDWPRIHPPRCNFISNPLAKRPVASRIFLRPGHARNFSQPLSNATPIVSFTWKVCTVNLLPELSYDLNLNMSHVFNPTMSNKLPKNLI